MTPKCADALHPGSTPQAMPANAAAPLRPASAGQSVVRPQRRHGLLDWLAARLARGPATAPARALALVEEYETRLMYSADLAATGLDLAGAAQPTEQRVIDNSGEFVQAAQSVRHELLIVGAGVEDSQTLLDSLASDGRVIEVLTLDPAKDSISQISTYLDGRHDLDAIHLLSHGAQGLLDLGATTLDTAALNARAGEIAAWGNAMTADADLLLYGCDVAAGDLGLAFVTQLASLTGSDVAASTDLTGNAGAAPAGNTGTAGNWTLEVQTGHIETANAFSSAALTAWKGTLESRVNSTTSGVQSSPAVASNAAGSFVVTWTTDNDGSGSGILMQRYNVDATTAGMETRVNSDTAGIQADSSVAMASNGSFVVVWASKAASGADQDGFSIQGQRFNADGTRAGGQFLINQNMAGDQELPQVSMAQNGDFVVAWQNSTLQQVMVRRYAANGSAVGGEIIVDGSSVTAQQRSPDIVLNNSGTFVVTWQSNLGASGDAIFARIYNADNSALSAKFMVNTYDGNDQRQPSIAADAAGDFTIQWLSIARDAGFNKDYFQHFSADGTKIGSEIRGSAIAYSDEANGDIGVMSDGRFVVVGDSADSSSTGIGIVQYSADDTVTFGPTLANQYLLGEQSNGALAVNGSGRVVLVWQGNGYDDDTAIYLRTYDLGNHEPIVQPESVYIGQNTTYTSTAQTNALANETDDEGDPIRILQVLNASDQGSVVTAAGVTVSGNLGTLFIKSDGSYVYTPGDAAKAIAAGQTVIDYFEYAVSDAYHTGSFSRLSINVTGTNDVPVAADDAFAVGTLASNGSFSFAANGLLANDTDVDTGDVLRITSAGGSASNVGKATGFATTYGTLTVYSDGRVAYAVDPTNVLVNGLLGNLALTDTINYTVSDGNGGTSTARIIIKIQANQHAPVAQAETYSYAEGTVLTVAGNGVLANDSDADNDSLHAILVGNPAHGTVSLSQTGAFVYTPDSGWLGSDSFSYRASDGNLSSALTTVILNPVHTNTAPTAVADPNTVEKGSLTTGLSVLTNDTDADSDSLRVITLHNTASGSSNVLSIASGASVTYTSNYGTLTLYSSGQYSYNANGPASMALKAGETSNDIYTYTITDGALTSTAQLSFAITGKNTAPVITGTQAGQQTNDESSVRPFSNVTITELEQQNVTLTVRMDQASKGAFSIPGPGVYDQAAGTYTISGTALAVTNALRALVFTPTANRVLPNGVETTTFTIVASDGTLSSGDSSTTVASTSINDAPVITGPGGVSIADDKTVVSPFASLTFADPDVQGPNVTVYIAIDDDKGVLGNLNGFVYHAGSGGGYTFTGSLSLALAATQGLTFTPTQNRVMPGQTEISTFAIRLTDAQGASANYSVQIGVTFRNDAPVITGAPASLQTDDRSAISPFAGISVVDPDMAQQILNLQVRLDPAATGILSSAAGGSYDASAGLYIYSGSATQVGEVLRAMVFAPGANRVAPGESEIASLRIEVSDQIALGRATTQISILSLNDAPVVSNVAAAQNTTDKQSIHPFGQVTVADADQPGQQLSVSVRLDHAELGRLTNLSAGSYDAATGRYTVSGTAAQVSQALRELEFVPTENRVAPGDSESAVLTLDVSDALAAALSQSTAVAILSINDAPVANAFVVEGASNDGAPLALSLGATDVDNAVVSFTLLNLPEDGVLSFDAAGVSLVAAGVKVSAVNGTHTLYFTPRSSWAGTARFAYLATDASGADSLMSAVVQVIVIAPSPLQQLADLGLAARPAAATIDQQSTSAAAGGIDTVLAPQQPIQQIAPAPAVDAILQLPVEVSGVSVAPAAANAYAQGSVGTSVERRASNTLNAAGFNPAAAFLLDSVAATSLADSPRNAQTRSGVDNAARAPEMLGMLDQMRETAKGQEIKMEQVVESTLAASTAITVGYVLWLLRGGALAASVLSALPAWRFVDPLPVLGALKNGDETEEDDSLEKMVENGNHAEDDLAKAGANQINKVEKT
ncbi:MAG: DUF4347 domain-containing protein [Janthinobacterium lividum]